MKFTEHTHSNIDYSFYLNKPQQVTKEKTYK